MNEIIKGIENLDDLIDGLIEPIKDYSDTVEDVLSPVKSLSAIYNLRKKIQLRKFLKGFHEKIDIKRTNNQELRSKLSKYLSNSKNVLYLSEIIENALASRSLRCTSILGYIAGKQILNDKPTDDIDDILLYALSQLKDFDLITLDTLKTKEIIYKKVGIKFEDIVEYRIGTIQKEIPEIDFGYPIQRILVSIERLKKEQILNYGAGGIGTYGNSNGTYIFGKVSNRLLEYMKMI
jgi:hypothetical protein